MKNRLIEIFEKINNISLLINKNFNHKVKEHDILLKEKTIQYHHHNRHSNLENDNDMVNTNWTKIDFEDLMKLNDSENELW